MCGNKDDDDYGHNNDAMADYDADIYLVLCGMCNLKVQRKLTRGGYVEDHKLEEYGFCRRCSMEISIFHYIGINSYCRIRGITEGSALQYFLLRKREWESKKNWFFLEKWFEPGSKSGIAFYRALNPDGEICYVVEDYGIGTVNLRTFMKKNGKAPIQRMEYKTDNEAREALGKLMKKNLQVIEDEFQKISPVLHY